MAFGMESVTRAMNQCRLAGSFAQKGRVLVHLEGRLRDQQQHPVIDLPDPEEVSEENHAQNMRAFNMTSSGRSA